MQAANDLIAALATPPGLGGVGIVRLSGDGIAHLAQKIIAAGRLPPPRQVARAVFVDADGTPLDDGICLYFSAPHSFTGQDVLELHSHGGAAARGVLSRCLALGARLAEPGEFTLRAHLNGKLDLAQAEALADLINAGSAAAARAAARSLTGEFSRRAESLAAQVVQLRAETEALLDFADEDIDAVGMSAARVAALRHQVEVFLRECEQGARLTAGLTAAIIGRPNVGKSSLLNALCGEDAAIVSATPGTTRDLIGREINLNGLLVRLTDTAGLRDGAEDIEREGMARARTEAQRADLILAIDDGVLLLADDDKIFAEAMMAGSVILRVRNKIDLRNESAGERDGTVFISAKTGAGIDSLRAAIARLGGVCEAAPSFSARARHLAALSRCVSCLQKAEDAAAQVEVAAAWLTSAHQCLQTLTGAFDDEDLLGEIFSKFCVGK